MDKSGGRSVAMPIS